MPFIVALGLPIVNPHDLHDLLRLGQSQQLRCNFTWVVEFSTVDITILIEQFKEYIPIHPP